jgi:hypothetical protein
MQVSYQDTTHFDELPDSTTFRIPLSNAMATALISLGLWGAIIWTVAALLH